MERAVQQAHPLRLDRPLLSPAPPALPLRAAVPAWAGLGLASALAWWLMLRGMAMGHPARGSGLAMGLPLIAFVSMWTLMMAAMMLPSVGPMVGTWSRSIRRETHAATRLTRAALFIAGYVVIWGATGALAYALCVGIDGVLARDARSGRWIAAAVFAAAGAWQLAPWKDACLRHCRSPLASLARYASWRGRLVDFRVGAHHGLFCIGCCFGLMLVLLTTGVMHLGAMVALTAIVFAEKVWRHGVALGRLAGVLLLLAACAAPWWPALHPGIG
jgi:predicted metal-binding membrane protein